MKTKEVIKKSSSKKQDDKQKDVEEKEDNQESSSKNKKGTFLTLTRKDNETKENFDPQTIATRAIFNGVVIKEENPSQVPIIMKSGQEKLDYSISSRSFRKYILEENPRNLAVINEEALKDLAELKRAWLKFGTSVLKVHVYQSYRIDGYEDFGKFCEEKLKLNQSTVYEIMRSTVFLMAEKPDVYEEFLSKKVDSLPSYRALYFIARKKEQLKAQGKFDKLVERVFEGKVSTRDVQKEIHDILGKKLGDIEKVIKQYQDICAELKKIKGVDIITKKAENILKDLREFQKKSIDK